MARTRIQDLAPLILAALLGSAFAAPAVAPKTGASARQALALKALAADVYWTQGAAVNSGVVVGRNGVVVIDAQPTADAARQLLAAIAAVTPKPVTHVILTHGDADHVNGLAAFPTGIVVIAHESARRDIETPAAAGGRSAPPKDRWPSRYVARTGETMTLEGVRVGIHHWSPAHTGGDVAVHLPAHKVVFAGDLVGTDVDPVIHLDRHGSSEGWITSVKGTLGLAGAQIVAGHGGVYTSAELQARLTAATAKRDRIAALVQEGKTLPEIKTTLGEPAPAAGARGPVPLTFADVVYQELTRRAPRRN